MSAKERPGRRYQRVACDECGGRGYLIVPDNGTNWGEETCDVCMGEGYRLEDEYGNSPDDYEPEPPEAIQNDAAGAKS